MLNDDGQILLTGLDQALLREFPEMMIILINAGATLEEINRAYQALQLIRTGQIQYDLGIGESDQVLMARENGQHIVDQREQEIEDLLLPYVGNRKLQ